jgi:hypothetical protein
MGPGEAILVLEAGEGIEAGKSGEATTLDGNSLERQLEGADDVIGAICDK